MSGRMHPGSARGTKHQLLFLLATTIVLLLGNRFSIMSSIDANLRGSQMKRRSDESISIGHLGNSIQYFNDCPRILEHMMQLRFTNVHQDSCLQGGSNITSLFEQGNSMKYKFKTKPASRSDGTFDIGQPTVEALLADRTWDYVAINDHTQSPVREKTREISLKTLEEKYLPLIGNSTTVVLIMTWAYKSPVKDSDDLGGFDHFTKLLWEGYNEYALIFPNVEIAPVGFAFQRVKMLDEKLWETLYAPDEFHPSPSGTLLEAYVLYITITGEKPPLYDPSWWNSSRFLQPEMPFPSEKEAMVLRDIAIDVYNTVEGESKL